MALDQRSQFNEFRLTNQMSELLSSPGNIRFVIVRDGQGKYLVRFLPRIQVFPEFFK